MNRLLFTMISVALLCCACQHDPTKNAELMPANHTIRIATFNVSMEATNYALNGEVDNSGHALTNALKSGAFKQINNIAEIIQRIRPDIILLNEFDYVQDQDQGINLFTQRYLAVSQNGFAPIEYPYVYLAPVNTGVNTPFSGKDVRLTHFGYGQYPGQYGMVLLSKYPIDQSNVRTFQHFLWKEMPDNLMPTNTDGTGWYHENEKAIMRLSSKSHWDIPVNVCGKQINVLASHPTPTVFDGPEDRNGKRNHDEIRLWKDYISEAGNDYLIDDQGNRGGIRHGSFVILGDLNASADEGDAYPGAMAQLLNHPRVNDYPAPTSKGGLSNKPENQFAATHTGAWGLRADYVLPSVDLTVVNSGIFWPTPNEESAALVADRADSSDHRLVWADVTLPNTAAMCSKK